MRGIQHHFCWYVCQWYITECNHKEISDKSRLRHILQNIWPVIWSWKLRGKLRKSSRLKRQWITQCDVWFWTGSFCYKRYYWNNINRAKRLNGSSVLMLIFWFCWLSCSYIGECPYWQEIPTTIVKSDWDMSAAYSQVVQGKISLCHTSTFSLWLFQTKEYVKR